MRDFVVFDIETKRTAKEIQEQLGLENERDAFGYPQLMQFGLGVIYDSKTAKYYEFTDANKFADFLLSKPATFVSWNGIRFDLPVLLSHINIDKYSGLRQRFHLDMLAEFYDAVDRRFRVSLNNIAQNSLGTQKTMNGSNAPLMLRQGKVKEVMEYCKNDVYITLKLLIFGLNNGFIQYWDSTENCIKKMKVDYKKWLRVK